MVAEAAPAAAADDLYAGEQTLFAQTTVLAFQQAGIHVSTVQDILDLGAYLTTALKCGKTSYAIRAGTVQECSRLLEQEQALFPQMKALMLMGDGVGALEQSHEALWGLLCPAEVVYKDGGSYLRHC